MTQFPNFKEFYGKAVVPMGVHDHEAFIRKFGESVSTHWYIAVEGIDIPGEKIKWRVVVYPAADNGATWDYAASHYETVPVNSLDEALETARKIEEQSFIDTLSNAPCIQQLQS
ncbi:hypothetical protein [Bacillus marinisedimentorum]|uniref:hypothetical protein n=1 Tax=Bacillus marinisedimentorum TaxID=1821260 RepID=UPI00087257A0|nr:hypothetical protein [Bacillus marinisedimentorum]